MSENKIVRETKLFKYNIESPTIAAEDIILSGIHLNSKLFGGETISTNFDVIQELAKNNITVGNRRAEQVIGFTMPIDEVRRGDKIASVTVKRIDNDTSGGAEAMANPVYMYIDMYDENNVLIQTFFSKDPVQQTAGDVAINGVFQTTWEFENVIIKSRCSKLEFRFSREYNSRQTNVRIRSHAMRVSANSQKIQLPGFKTIYPGGSIQSYTTEFTAVFGVVVTGLQSHSEDTTLHLSPEKDQKIASIDLLQETINGHVADEDRHITVVERQQISLNTNNITMLSSNVAAIQTVLQSTTRTQSTIRQGLSAHLSGRLAAKCIQLSKQHFLQDYVDTKISEIHIPYYNEKEIDANKTAKLCVQFFYEDEVPADETKPNDIPKTLQECIFSENEVTQTIIGGTPVSKFYFSSLTVPDEFKFVRLCFVSDSKVVPNAATGENCVDYRIRVLSPTNSQSNYTGFDIDDCKVFTGNGQETNYVGYVKMVSTCSVLDQIDQIGQFSDHIGNTEIHVTAEDKERWNNIVIPELPEIPEPITYTAGDGIDITDNTISVISTDVIEESDKIPTAKALYNTFYGTRTFNNYDTSKYTDAADTVGTIVLSKKHFISGGRITKVTVPHGNTDEDLKNGQGGFLVIDVFKEDTSYSEGYNIAEPTHRYCADEYYAYKNRLNEGHYEWTFNNTECIIPDDYKVVHLSLVVDNANVSKVGVTSATNAQFRINCLAKNGNKDEGVVYEEDDECKLYWQGGANGANRVAIVQVEYIGNKLNDYYIVPMLLERISALEARVSELENS